MINYKAEPKSAQASSSELKSVTVSCWNSPSVGLGGVCIWSAWIFNKISCPIHRGRQQQSGWPAEEMTNSCLGLAILKCLNSWAKRNCDWPGLADWTSKFLSLLYLFDLSWSTGFIVSSNRFIDKLAVTLVAFFVRRYPGLKFHHVAGLQIDGLKGFGVVEPQMVGNQLAILFWANIIE